MRDFAEEMRQQGKQKRSRQEMINKVMCKPGYTWNETVGKCLGPAAGGGGNVDLSEFMTPSVESAPPANPEQAIAQEVSARAMRAE